MSELSAAHRERLEGLKRAYWARLDKTVHGVVSAAGDLRLKPGPEAVEALFRVSHRVAGSAALHGCARVCEAAGAIEAYAAGCRGRLPSSHAELEALVDTLTRACREDQAEPPTP
jgi:hypothetical protein